VLRGKGQPRIAITELEPASQLAILLAVAALFPAGLPAVDTGGGVDRAQPPPFPAGGR
jgi:hypothetical protein